MTNISARKPLTGLCAYTTDHRAVVMITRDDADLPDPSTNGRYMVGMTIWAEANNSDSFFCDVYTSGQRFSVLMPGNWIIIP